MFNRKDPLLDSVKNVMKENELRRDAERKLNEELGIASKKALPFEHHANYDALLEQKIAEALKGNQHKIDANKNNKIDAHDFKLLRGQKKVEEADTKSNDSAQNTNNSSSTPPATKYAIPTDDEVKAIMNRSVSAVTKGMSKELGTDNSSKLKEEDDKSVQGSGAVTKDGKDVVSSTAPKAEGPTDKERAALTNKVKEVMKEAKYSAKEARAGKDIGKPGKMFKKIASDAAKRYGSEERGKKVAGAVLAKLRSKSMEEQSSSSYGAEKDPTLAPDFNKSWTGYGDKDYPVREPKKIVRPIKDAEPLASGERDWSPLGDKAPKDNWHPYAGAKPPESKNYRPPATKIPAGDMDNKAFADWKAKDREANPANYDYDDAEKSYQQEKLPTRTYPKWGSMKDEMPGKMVGGMPDKYKGTKNDPKMPDVYVPDVDTEKKRKEWGGVYPTRQEYVHKKMSDKGYEIGPEGHYTVPKGATKDPATGKWVKPAPAAPDRSYTRKQAQDSMVKEETIEEKAPPGAKFERMVKHIKKKYAKDGLTKQEKSIAYATAWKAKNKEEMKEAVEAELRKNLGEKYNKIMEDSAEDKESDAKQTASGQTPGTAPRPTDDNSLNNRKFVDKQELSAVKNKMNIKSAQGTHSQLEEQDDDVEASPADRAAFRARTGSTVGAPTSNTPADVKASPADREAFRSRTGSTVGANDGGPSDRAPSVTTKAPSMTMGPGGGLTPQGSAVSKAAPAAKPATPISASGRENVPGPNDRANAAPRPAARPSAPATRPSAPAPTARPSTPAPAAKPASQGPVNGPTDGGSDPSSPLAATRQYQASKEAGAFDKPAAAAPAARPAAPRPSAPRPAAPRISAPTGSAPGTPASRSMAPSGFKPAAPSQRMARGGVMAESLEETIKKIIKE